MEKAEYICEIILLGLDKYTRGCILKTSNLALFEMEKIDTVVCS